jgi:phosphate starvation-inducible protein PhoH
MTNDINVRKHWKGHELIESKIEIGKTAFGVRDAGCGEPFISVAHEIAPCLPFLANTG